MILSKLFNKPTQVGSLKELEPTDLHITYNVTKCGVGYHTVVQIDYLGEEEQRLTYLITLDKNQEHTKNLTKGLTLLHMYHTIHKPDKVNMDILEVK